MQPDQVVGARHLDVEADQQGLERLLRSEMGVEAGDPIRELVVRCDDLRSPKLFSRFPKPTWRGIEVRLRIGHR